ncbi:calcium-binding protein, partial [Limimaricola sp. ASW11-118]|nr:calcium-binding protein [Limimaricola litoreus]
MSGARNASAGRALAALLLWLGLAMAGAATSRSAAAAPAPVLGMNLAGISDWSTEHPFLDLMKSSRPWIGHLPGRWGGVEAEALVTAGHVDAGGRLLSIPPGVKHVGTLILTDQPEAAVSLAGRYVLRHEGRGEVSVGGRAREVSRAPGEIRFDYTPGHGAVEIEVAAIDARDPLRDISVVREDRLPHAAAGALFNPDWLALVSDLRLLRVMDWMETNGSKAQRWEDRPRQTDQRWTEGVPAEVLARLANEIGADLWVTLPHLADDAYARGFAELMYEALDPRLKLHAEWSNEVWNFGFRQAKWAEEQAKARWGEEAPGDAWMQFAGLRAAQVADIWAEVFGAQAKARLVRVIGVQTGWRGLEAAALD